VGGKWTMMLVTEKITPKAQRFAHHFCHDVSGLEYIISEENNWNVIQIFLAH